MFGGNTCFIFAVDFGDVLKYCFLRHNLLI